MSISIRRAEPADAAAITEMIHGLARFEKAPEQCTVVESQISSALFDESPTLRAHVADVDGEVAAMALWFLNFSTWDGVEGIYLEDLFVRPAHRGKGRGKALLVRLATTCVENGWSRLQWAVLDWNTPSIEFYTSLGGIMMDDWTLCRVTGAALQRLAGQGA